MGGQVWHFGSGQGAEIPALHPANLHPSISPRPSVLAHAAWADAIERQTQVPGIAVVLARIWAHRRSFELDTDVEIYAIKSN